MTLAGNIDDAATVPIANTAWRRDRPAALS
jgi:hypothetical protein